MFELVLIGLLVFAETTTCCHGKLDPKLGGFCHHCDTGMST